MLTAPLLGGGLELLVEYCFISPMDQAPRYLNQLLFTLGLALIEVDLEMDIPHLETMIPHLEMDIPHLEMNVPYLEMDIPHLEMDIPQQVLL